MPSEDKQSPGFKLRYVLRGHRAPIQGIAWSPNGQRLASASRDNTVLLWDTKTRTPQWTFSHSDWVTSVAWSPDGKTLASGSSKTIWLWDVENGKELHKTEEALGLVHSLAWSPDGSKLASASAARTVDLWDIVTPQVPSRSPRTLYGKEPEQSQDTKSCKLRQTLEGHQGEVNCVGWSPDGQALASGGEDHAVRLWDAKTGEVLGRFRVSSEITSIVWSPDGRTLAVSSNDYTIRLWNPKARMETNVLEGHVTGVVCITFSSDGKFLASKSLDGVCRIWRCDTWEAASFYSGDAVFVPSTSLAFHPSLPILATLGERATVIRILDLDTGFLLGTASDTVHYTNTKIVLVGDTGVGKTGLSLALTDQPFVATESTHGRRVWNFDSHEINLANGRKEVRETLLWDLAGQPGYRLIHQLHLNEVTVALVVFDARSETDPFTGVHHWDRALRQAQFVQGESALPMKKFLVAARADRGRIAVSPERIQALVHDLDFDGHFDTSAKEGWQITELARAIRAAIRWEALPKISSTKLFWNIKAFLVAEKEAGRLLSTVDDLYRTFLTSKKGPAKAEELYAQFKTCIALVESRGLIRRFSFGDLVLLQPELLDSYASALVNAARDQPDGLGSIAEEDALVGRFRIPEDERIKDKEQEKLLLIATKEELLHHEIALREQSELGPYLVFPSQLTREYPDLPDPEGKAVVFTFEGPALSIYVTLAVRLSHSGMFSKKEMWKNAATYTATESGTCGIFLREIEEGYGELTLFFDRAASEETRFHFEEYIRAHLQRRALPNSVSRQRVFMCPKCETPVTNLQAARRQERGFRWIRCSVCDHPISLLDREERLRVVLSPAVREMEQVADKARERETAASILQGKIITGDFDVFLCHDSADKPAIKLIGERLKERGILPWLDEWELRPGLPWQKALETQIGRIKSAAVFVGKSGIGPWQGMEEAAFLRQFVKRGCPVIPVIMADCQDSPKLPVFLEGMTWVDFRKQDPDPIQQLIWGITGKRDRGS